MSHRAELTAPEAELALLLIGTRERRARTAGRIRTLAERIDHQAFADFLVRQRLFLLVGTRLLEAAPDAAHPGLVSWVDQALATARVRGLLFSTVTTHLVQRLDRQRIPAMPLKGAGLAGELYGNEALRAYDDIDVLVPSERLAEAVAVARGLGWVPVGPDDPLAAGLPTLHVFLRHGSGTLPDLELHWRIHWYESRFASAMFDRSRLIDGSRRLDPVDQLAALLLFYARDGVAGLRLAADIAAWWDQDGSAERVRQLGSLIERHPQLAEPWRVALASAVDVAGLPLQSLPPMLRPRHRRSRLASRLANWDLRGEDDQIKANVALIDGLLAPPNGLGAFAARQLTPPAELVQTGSHARVDRRGAVAAWRLAHAGKTAGRFLFALWRVRHGRRWTHLPAECNQGQDPIVPAGDRHAMAPTVP